MITSTVHELKLTNTGIHIWKSDIKSQVSNLSSFKRLLSEIEIQRAERFKFEKDKTTFIISRALLRKLLGYYLSFDPKDLSISTNKYGKPYIDNNFSLKFNLAHTTNLFIAAFSKDQQVGVDAEWIDSSIKPSGLAKEYFSENEYQNLTKLPRDKRLDYFFSIWTKKEAFIKASGKGLSIPLQEFDVSSESGEINWESDSDQSSESDEERDWSVESIKIDSGYKAAIATQKQDFKISYFNIGK